MSQRSRCSLAVALLTALSLALPAPSQAVPVPSVWMARALSWLESFGLVPGKPDTAARHPNARFEKAGGTTTGVVLQTEPAPPPRDTQGSGIDPNGGTR